MANIPIKDLTEQTELHDGDMTVIGDGSQTNTKFNLGKALGELIKRTETYTKAQIDSLLLGKVDDVKVEGTSVVTNKVANVTKTSLGLNNVDNTSDLNKPISTATQDALNQKQSILFLSVIDGALNITYEGE